MLDAASGAPTLCGTQRPANEQAAARDLAALRTELQSLKVINYYPAGDGWTYMWTRWNPEAIDADFARIATANANGVRVIVHPSVFGFPEPDSKQLSKLAYVVETAEQHGLRVQLTLFDWWLDYARIDESRRWATAILEPYRDDPRVAFVELQNELDAANNEALSWARAMIPCVREVVGSIPITISVSGSHSLPGLQRLVDAQLGLDFYDLHYYGKAALAYHTFNRARSIVGIVPLRIGETGYATHPIAEEAPSGTDIRWREAEQDKFYRTLAVAARENELPPVAPWILSDFRPGAIPLTRSAPDPAQSAFGLLRVDGTPKPAMASIRSMFGGDAPDEHFNNGFEDATDSALPTNWKLWRAPLAGWARDPNVHRSGRAAARISRSSSSVDGYPAFYLSPVRPIVAGDYYTATVWVRAQAATGTTRISLAWFNADGMFLGHDVSSELREGTTDWTQLSLIARAPLDAALVEIHLVSANNTGTVWFDDVRFD
jgi:hypothetical protein